MNISESTNSTGALLGVKGAVIVTDTNTYNGPFYSLKAISQCVIDTIVSESIISGSLNGLTILAGDTIMLYRMTSVKLTSGAAILYNA